MKHFKQQSEKKREKPPYSIFSNTLYLLRRILKERPWIAAAELVTIPMETLMPLLGSYLTAAVVSMIENGSSDLTMLATLGILTAVLIGLGILSNVISYHTGNYYFELNYHYLRALNQKSMRIDYALLESPHGQDMRNLASGNVNPEDTYGSSNVATLPWKLVQMFSRLFQLISYSAILAILNPWLILVISAATVIPYFTTQWVNRLEHAHREEVSNLHRQFAYLGNNMSNRNKAKDIIFYRMTAWFLALFWDAVNGILAWRRKFQLVAFFGIDVVSAFLTLLQNVAAYGLLIAQVCHNDMPLSSFIFYFSIITGFSQWLSGLLYDWANTLQSSRQFCDLRTYLELPDSGRKKNEPAKKTDLPDGTWSVAFCNVSFRYPSAETAQDQNKDASENWTLRHLNFKIEKGEKIAVVGLNGAGKTTLVKLLCGLLEPTEGQILINGTPLSDYSRDAYFQALSVVFQDIFQLPVSIRQNITLCPDAETDEKRLASAIEEAGIAQRIASLPAGLDTLLGKSIRNGAVDLSGGELQKLALARALYKGGQMMVLDEPTSALDPIAENRMYLEYNKMTAENTAVFISHRLSSTRFCDRILLLENGRITESGTHESLMQKNGAYAKLFDIQSHYYKEEVSADEAAEN